MVWINEEPWEELNYNGSLTLQCHEPYLREVEEYLRKTGRKPRRQAGAKTSRR